uniref:Uncharacterized protein n=1 Tax=Compsopogon caeruleus TaxID=31354 RepID=A0A1Z1XB28_9RHOD|nr:hypothetical protein [Compsopogon caeruleus]ARX96028.1 hypothetical protein [Compsopogon caeruleus]
MNNLIGIIYLLCLLVILIIFCFFITKEINKIYNEQNMINYLFSLGNLTQEDHLLKTNIYFSKKIFDITIYEIKFLIRSTNLARKDLANLYNLLGKSYELLNNNLLATDSYKKALSISLENNNIIINYLNILIKERQIDKAQNFYNYFLNQCPENSEIKKEFKGVLSIKTE